MILYHGSDAKVEKPDLDLSRKSLDFGVGFYTTESRDQAVEFARKVMIRKGQKSQLVNVFDFNLETARSNLDILQFATPDRLWLDYVHQNRKGVYTGKSYDLVMGPVANDDVYATLIIYEQGILTVEQAIETLKIKKLYNQFVFKTEKALSFLKYSKSFEPETKS